MLKAILILILFLSFPGFARAQTPEAVSERTSPPPVSDVARLVDARLGNDWHLVAQGIDVARDRNIQQEGAVWGEPVGDRLVVVRINVADQSPSAITEAWTQAQKIFGDQGLVERSETEAVVPSLPCVDMFWGSRDDSGPIGSGVTGFQTLGMLCATSPSEFYVVLYSSFRLAQEEQFTIVKAVVGDGS